MVLAGLVATLAAGLFAGAGVYITLVEHPARTTCGTAIALTEFGPSYKRAAVMQALLAVVGTSAGLMVSVGGGGTGWLVGSVMLGTVVPFTLVVVMPTNRRLLDPSLDRSSSEAAALLSRWGRLHAVRSLLGLAAFVVFLVLSAD